MALADTFAAAQDPRVVAQVTAAIYQAAANIYGEASTTAGHAARAAFANKIATGAQALQPLILSTVAFGTLSAASTDTSVNNAVSSLWNSWAGA